MGSEILVFIVIAVIMGLLSLGVKVVKQDEVMVIERLGVFHKILEAGCHYIVPNVDRVKKIVSLKEKTEKAKGQFKTFDDQVVELETTVHFVIKDPKIYVYGESNFQKLPSLINEKVKYEILKINAVDLKLDLLHIEMKITESLNEVVDSLGIQVSKVTIQ